MKTIEPYLKTVEADRRPEIERINAIVGKIEPSVTEGISYGMPALMYRDKALASVMQTKSFLSYYPYSGKVIDALSQELSPLKCTTGSIHLTPKQMLSERQLEQLVTLRRNEIDALIDRS